jgi:hypothetical protein
LHGSIQKLVLVITSAETGETIERWSFDVETDKNLAVSEKYFCHFEAIFFF